MKANKIVFSTIAALALSSSAFATTTALDTYQDADWYKQVYKSAGWGSNDYGNLNKLGWEDGAGAISAVIAGTQEGAIPDSQFGDNIGILGALNSKVGDKQVTANYKSHIENKITASLTLTANVNTQDVTTYNLYNATKDYIAVAKAVDMAQRAQNLLTALKANNADGFDSGSLQSDLATNFAFKENTTKDQLQAVANAILTNFEGLEKADDSGKMLDNDAIANLRKAKDKLDTTEVQNVVKSLFAETTGVLNAYKDANNLDKISTEIANLKSLQEAIDKNADAIIAKADAANAADITKLQNELAEAVKTYKTYATNNFKLQNLKDEATRISGDVFANGVTQQFTNSYVNIYENSGAKILDQAVIKNKINEQATTALNTVDNALADGIKASDLISAQGKATFSQIVAYAESLYGNGSDETNGSTKTTFCDGSTQNVIKTNETAIKALRIVDKAIKGQGKLEFTQETLGVAVSDTANVIADLKALIVGAPAFKNSSTAFAKFADTDLEDYLKAMLATETSLSQDNLNKIVNANNAVKQLQDSLAGEFFAVAKAKEQIDQALSNANIANIPGVGDAKKELEDAFSIVDENGDKAPATVDTIETKVTALGYNNAIDENSTKLFEEFGVKLDNTDTDTKKASITALKTAITDRYGKYGIKIDESGKVALKDGVVIKDKDNNEVSSANMVDVMKRVAVMEQNDKIQTAVNKIAQTVAQSKKDSLAVEGLSTLNIQLNNMNKRLGEIRGLDGEIGVWLRTWGGKMSADHDSFKYYSTQLGADKKTAMKDGDLYLGVLVGYDNVKSDIKSNAYSVGAYASYIDNSGFFADGVMKFVSTKNERSGYSLSNQQTLLASIEGGYRFDMSDGFYVEPSLEFVTGHVGEYKSVKDNTTLKVDSFTPVVFKPQVFVGGSADAFTYRAGVGGVLSMQGQDASVTMANVIKNLDEKDVSGTNSVKLSKNNHGFASIGGSFKASENFRINLGVERSFGGDLTNDYEVNMTLRYGF